MAQSSFYRVSQCKLPSWEWISPTPEEFDQYLKDHKCEDSREAVAKHIEQGGLLLRKLSALDLHKYMDRRIQC